MRKIRLFFFCIPLFLFLSGAVAAHADTASYGENTASYRNEETGYQAILNDDADLLTSAEEQKLLQEMVPITEFGNVAFHSTSSHGYGNAEDYARAYLASLFHGESSTMFMIDMRLRKVVVWSDGAAHGTITNGRGDTIADNIYSYASRGEYYACAAEAFSEIRTLLQGGQIAQPMKYASNALLALAIALLVMFIIVNAATSLKQAKESEILAASRASFTGSEPTVVQTGTTREYRPIRSSGGGGGGGGGFSGGGGGFSGGGGGGSHSF